MTVMKLLLADDSAPALAEKMRLVLPDASVLVSLSAKEYPDDGDDVVPPIVVVLPCVIELTVGFVTVVDVGAARSSIFQ